MRSLKSICAVLICLAIAAPVSARPSLRDVPEIEDPLFAVAVAHVLRERCPELEGKELKGIAILWGLRAKANRMGYSDQEIIEYVRSDAEKERFWEKGRALLRAYGPIDDTASYCAMGRDEIQKNSAIGALLRAK